MFHPYKAQPLLRFTVILSIAALLSACSDESEMKNAFAKKASEILSSVISGKSGNSKDNGSDNGSDISVSITGKKEPTDPSLDIKKLLVLPGSTVSGYIKGIECDTINTTMEATLEDVELNYRVALAQAGYEVESIVLREGMFTGQWLRIAHEARVSLYGYQQGNVVKLSIVYTPIL